MKKIIANIALLLGVFFVLRAFMGSPSQPSPQPSVQVSPAPSPVAKPAPSPSVAPAPARDSVPQLATLPSPALAEDVLAKNYLVILDDSGSMSGQKIADAKGAMEIFCRSVPAQANLGLSTFRGDCAVKVPLGLNNRPAFLEAVKMAKASESTPLCQAITKAYAELNLQRQKQLGYGEYHLVIVTDGASTDGDPRQLVNDINRSSPVIIHTIGFQIGLDHSLNQPGKVLYQSAQNKGELTKMLDNVLAESDEFSDISIFK